MQFNISDREREQLSKQAAKAAAAYMEMSDGLAEDDMMKVAIATVQASILAAPLVEQLTSIYIEMSGKGPNE